MVSADYEAFLERRAQAPSDGGFAPITLPDWLFPFQRLQVEWAIRKGRSALFNDCGLGKTPMQLVWAENVKRHANRPVLVLTPLAVGGQTVREAAKFGIEARRDTKPRGAEIVVANYERLHHADPSEFAGVVCDESSILKAFDGQTRARVTEFLRVIPYRLLCTATASPNDYIELGTSSEALGYLGHMDMLGMFFKNDNNTTHDSPGGWRESGWRFKKHAQEPFWRWVCSWARACRRPSDLGFSDEGFDLPPLEEREHLVQPASRRPGFLFDLPADGLQAQREERRRTTQERCEKVAELLADADSAVAWCHLNPEGDLLEQLIPGAVQVSGRDCDEAKEEKFEAFARGEARVLVTKPKIGSWGLNWQHCARTTFFPSHSFEQYYQAVRRFYRFGQKRTVRVDVVASEGERGVMSNLKRKSDQSDAMFTALVRHMTDALKVERSAPGTQKTEAPSWL